MLPDILLKMGILSGAASYAISMTVLRGLAPLRMVKVFECTSFQTLTLLLNIQTDDGPKTGHNRCDTLGSGCLQEIGHHGHVSRA